MSETEEQELNIVLMSSSGRGAKSDLIANRHTAAKRSGDKRLMQQKYL